jgi:ADP-ribose pyrophosphatase
MPKPNNIILKTDACTFNYRVGAIITNGDKILLASNNRDSHFYTVGGRVQLGETSEQALKREICEELGSDCNIAKLAAIHENFFEEHGVTYHEIALFYLVELPNYIDITREHPTNGGLLEKFQWFDIDKTDSMTVYPTFLKTDLPTLGEQFLHFVTDERNTNA